MEKRTKSIHSIEVIKSTAGMVSIFKEVLEKKLHLEKGEIWEGRPVQNSRMHMVATNGEAENMWAVVARNVKGDAIGWCLLQRERINWIAAYQLKNPFRDNSTKRETYDWGYLPCGFLSFYTAKPYRGLGIARDLLKTLDNALLEEFRQSAVRPLHPLDLPLYRCAAGTSAEWLITQHSQFGIITKLIGGPACKQALHFLTRRRLEKYVFGEEERLGSEYSWETRAPFQDRPQIYHQRARLT
jgi:GNAT superfamily N-acetyltransferase